MGDKLPNLCYYNSQEQFHKPYSEKTAELIDNEVKALIAEQYERAKRLLLEHCDGHRQLADLLMEREVIFAEDAERIFGKRAWASRSEEILEPAEVPVAEEILEEETVENVVEVEKEETPVAMQEVSATQEQPDTPTLADVPSSEQSERSKPVKPKASRQHKSDDLFDEFDFEGEDKE
jgi:cell division protease FtsH